MKLFKLDFNKDGKGIEKDAPQKRAFFRFWIRFWEKRYSIIGANFLYLPSAIISLFVATLIFLVAASLFVTLEGSDNAIAQFLQNKETTEMARQTIVTVIAFTAITTTVIPIFAVGPLYAGFTYLLRSFVTENPVFLWHDFKTKTRSNFKLGLKVGLTNFLAGFFLMVDAAAYMAISNNSQGQFSNVPSFILFVAIAVILFLSLLLMMVNLYVYPIMVTFNVTYKQLYKNAVILSLLRWIPNLLILILNAVLIALPFLFMFGNSTLVISTVLYIFFTPAFIGFLNNFYVNNTIKKYLIDNESADKSKEITEEVEGDVI
ncbi:MAG: DUF624 domain-containing protein [Clostridiaceae bacterium]|nr:DUF624 domain-containing protein [Clostridiaceae bacterium]HOA32818.1 hypothetical protein [Clostridia bacterium]